jgi:hypothetical protein
MQHLVRHNEELSGQVGEHVAAIVKRDELKRQE